MDRERALADMARLVRKEGWVRLEKLSRGWRAEDPEWSAAKWAHAWARIQGAWALPDPDVPGAFALLREAVAAGAPPPLADVPPFPLGLFGGGDPMRRIDAYERMVAANTYCSRSRWSAALHEAKRAAALVPDHRDPWDQVYRIASTAGDTDAMAEAKQRIARLEA